MAFLKATQKMVEIFAKQGVKNKDLYLTEEQKQALEEDAIKQKIMKQHSSKP